MNNKILLAIIAIIAVVAIGSVAFSLGIFGQTTEVDTKFLSGTIQGKAVEDNTNVALLDWQVSYNDTENGIEYAFSMMNSFNFTKDMLTNVMGLKKVDTKDYNNVKWDIYYLNPDLANNKVKNMDANDFNSNTLDISGYVCFASGKNGEYIIIVSSDNMSSDNSLNSELFKDYVEPLLKSINLKDPQNPPKEYQFANMTNEEYNFLRNYINENGWDTVINNM